MLYEITSTTNVESLLLHHYRILRHTDSKVPEPFRQGSGIPIIFRSTNSYDASGYKQLAEVTVPDNCIPMVEFDGDQAGLDVLAEATYLETQGNSALFLITERPAMNSLKATLYWCSDLSAKVADLESRVAKLEELIENLGRTAEENSDAV